MRVRKRLLDGKEKYGAFVLIASLLVTLAMLDVYKRQGLQRADG